MPAAGLFTWGSSSPAAQCFPLRPLSRPSLFPPRSCWKHAPAWRGRRAARVVQAAGEGPNPTAPSERFSAAAANRGWSLPALLKPLSDPAANTKLLALCAAQMLGYVGSLMQEVYLPLYLSDVLRLSHTQIGNLQALSQFLSKASGVLSGRLADLLSPGRMVLLGTLLTALAKPMLALSGVVHAALGAGAWLLWVSLVKMLDSVSKGVQEAPYKALIGELAAQSGDSPAPAFSLRQSLGTLGMLLGSAVAGLTFHASGRSFMLTFALAGVPAALALALVWATFGGRQDTGVSKGEGPVAPQESPVPKAKAALLLRALPPAYWEAVAVVCLLYLARFDLSFTILRAKSVMGAGSLPMLTPLMMLPVILLAAPVGLRAKASVRARNTMLVLGISVLIAGDLCFAFLPSALGMVLGSLCIGVQMAFTQGVVLGMLASYIPSSPIPGLGRVNGTAWSLTDLQLGAALAGANSLAGRLSDFTAARGYGGTGCFLGGAAAGGAAILALALFSVFGDLGKEPEKRGPAAASAAG